MAAISPQRGIDVSRRPYQRRQYLVDCQCCHQWRTVETRALQAVCQEAKTCPQCMKDDYWLLRVQIVAIEVHMERIVKQGQELPEDQRGPLRLAYTKKAQQLARAKARLEKLRPADNHCDVVHNDLQSYKVG